MTPKKPVKGLNIGMHQAAVDRERAKEKKDRKCADMEADIQFFKTELDLLKKRVSELESAEG